MPVLQRQVYDVAHLDSIHLGRKAVVFFAWGDGHVLGWYAVPSVRTAARG